MNARQCAVVWTVLAGLLPLRALARPPACRPAMWRDEVHHAMTTDARVACPQVDDKATLQLSASRSIAVCGETTRCGRDYVWVLAGNARYLAAASEVTSLAASHPLDLPVAVPDDTRPMCTLGAVVPSGGDFFVVGPLRAEWTEVSDVLRLLPSTPVVACRRIGDLTLAYVHGRLGLLQHADVRLSNQRHPQAYWSEATPFCYRPIWTGRTRQPTVLYIPNRTGNGDETVALATGTEVEILSAQQNGDTLWYGVGHAAVRGFVLAAEITTGPWMSLQSPLGPIRNCPHTAHVARTRRPLSVQPLGWLGAGPRAELPPALALPAGMELPIVAQTKGHVDVWVHGMVARLSDPAALQTPQRQVALELEPSSLLQQVSTDGCDQKVAFADLQPGIPDSPGQRAETPPEAPPSRPPVTVAGLSQIAADGADRRTLRHLVSGARPVLTALHHEVDAALAPRVSRPLAVEPAPQGVARRIGTAEYEAGAALLSGNPAQTLDLLAPCLAGHCDSGTGRFLAAEAFLRLGLPAIAAQWLLDTLASHEGPLDQVLHAYHESVRRFAPSPRAAAVLRPYCDGAISADAEACFLALQAALEAEDRPAADLLAYHLRRVARTAQHRALLALFDGVYRGRMEDAAFDLAAALAHARRTCPSCAELTQTLLLQTAHAAYEFGDVDAAERAVRGLQPAMVARGGDLAATVLLAAGHPGQAQQALTLHARTDAGKGPEIPLWNARLALEECRFADYRTASALLAARMGALQQIAAPARREVAMATDARQALKSLDALLRRHQVTSRHLPQLARLLSPTGPCGQWAEWQRESATLRAAVPDGYRAPPWLDAQLGPRLADIDARCLQSLRDATGALDVRLAALVEQHAELAVDHGEVLVQQLDLAQQWLGRLHDLAAKNLTTDAQTSGGVGSPWGLALGQLNHVARFPIDAALASLAAVPAPTPRQFEEALLPVFERCAANAPPPPATGSPGADAVAVEVARAVRCLDLLARETRQPMLLPFFVRYLPAARLVDTEILRFLPDLHGDLLPLLRQWATAGATHTGRCLADRPQDELAALFAATPLPQLPLMP